MRRNPLFLLSTAMGLATLLPMPGCKTTNDSGSKSRMSSNSSSCPSYPRIYTADPEAKVRAEQALTTLAHDTTSTPSLDWSDVKGSLKTLNNVAISVCKDAGDLNQAVKDVVAAHPELFQIAESDWTFPIAVPCSNLDGGGRQIVTLRRKAIGEFPQPLSRDVLSFVIENDKKKTYVKSVFGSYLPSADDTFKKILSSCEDSPYQAPLTKVLQSAAYPLATFNNCSYVAPAQYIANAKDRVEFDPASTWDWTDEGQSIAFYKSATGRVRIDSSNVNDTVKSSDAFCNDNIGFEIGFDPVTAELKAVKNGIGCVVCFR